MADKTKAETDADNAKAAKAKSEAEAAASARQRVASGNNEDDPRPNKVQIMPRSAADAAAAKPQQSANTVTVGCKLPHGLVLTLNEKVTTEEDRPIYRATGPAVTLAGRNASQIIGGYGMTEVDADWWDAWVKQNQNFQPYKSGLIFAEPRRDKAMDRAMEQRQIATGSEPIDPDKPGKGLTRVSEQEQRGAQAMGGNV
jgi:hypothetical protein